jgi:hypothetical protein
MLASPRMNRGLRPLVVGLLLFAVTAPLLFVGINPPSASASHGWQSHWASSSSVRRLDLGDCVAGHWDNYKATVATWWSTPTRLDATFQGCQVSGVEGNAYSANYGATGWDGYATVWWDGSRHTTSAKVQLNNYRYLNATTARAIFAHEVGHVAGLAHSSNTLMCSPLCGYLQPTQHDYDQLDATYGHADGYATLKAGPVASTTSPALTLSGSEGERHDHAQPKTSLPPGEVKRLDRGQYQVGLAEGAQASVFVDWASEEAARNAPDNRLPTGVEAMVPATDHPTQPKPTHKHPR